MGLGVHSLHRDIQSYHDKTVHGAPNTDPEQQWVTIGDMHGNALKLLDLCHVHGILDVSEADYLEFAEIYQGRVLTDTWEDILNRIKVTDNAHLRLIGDLLADRGSSDHYTLDIICKLVDEGVKLEIIASNHDMVFIAWMEAILARDAVKAAAALEEMPPQFTRSLQNYAAMCGNEVYDDGDVRNIITEVYDKYKKNLKLLSYPSLRKKPRSSERGCRARRRDT